MEPATQLLPHPSHCKWTINFHLYTQKNNNYYYEKLCIYNRKVIDN